MIIIKKRLHILLIILILILFGCSSTQSSLIPSNKDIPVIFDALSVSRVSSDHLIEKLGDPEDIETWKNQTSKGTFDMQIYCYSIDNSYYEFLISDDSVVRMNIYSANYWYHEGDDFSYLNMNKSDTLAMFGITPSSEAKITADTGVSYRIAPVCDDVSDFFIPVLDESTCTFGNVKITFNPFFFE